MPVSRSQIGAKLFSEIVFATCSLRVLDASSNKERITMTDNSQFIHLGAYGRAPRKNAPRWSCISGITAEAARMPGACNHLRYRGEPLVLFGGSPLEAGRLATERADQAVDATGVRRLRCDSIALLAGVASYPIPRQLFYDMPAEGDAYC